MMHSEAVRAAELGRDGALGPYRLSESLGAGGMGVVYLAHHRQTNERVALKTVRTLEPEPLRGLRREVGTLRRLQHPNVVRVLDEGLADQVPWYAMELLDGVPLRALLSELWRAPASGGERPLAAGGHLGRALGLVRRLCSALGFIHGEGLVHRDLKPENVFVRPGDVPVLMDFGMAAGFGGARGRDPLEVGGLVEGSLGYMAPEQLCGDLVDARADLYALGCILYELVAGRPAFSGRGPEVLRQHLSTPPSPPSRWVDGVPGELEALILRLLAKQPRDRVGYADDVANALRRIEDAGSEPVAAHPPGRAYLYRPEFAGRARLLGELERALDRAKLGEGGLILLGAESGAGKTRLATEVATAANRRAFRVITGECLPMEGDTHHTGVRGAPLHPFLPFLDAVADHCRAYGPEATDALLGGDAGLLALYAPALARIPGRTGPTEPPALSPQEARHRLVEVLDRTLTAFAAEQPLLLVLDDLHWADELSLYVLTQLQRAGWAGRRLLVLGTYRTEEQATLGDVLATPGIRDERLSRLDEETLARIVADMLALTAPPEAFVRFLSEQSAGNPFFVAEYLRTAVDEGLLRRTTAGRWEVGSRGHALEQLQEALPLPGTLRELLGRWLARLRPEARELLEAAAVLGREFDGGLLAPEVPEDDVAHAGLLQQLRARQVLEEAGAGRLRFAHDKLREIAYANIPAARRRGLHEVAAARIEAQAGTDPLSFGLLSHHWLMAEVPGKAFEYLEKAGGHALRTGANRDAVNFLERAVSLVARLERDGAPVDARRKAACERLLGESYYGLGNIAEARRHLLATFDELGTPLPRGRAGWVGLLFAEAARQTAHLLGPERPAHAADGTREPLRLAALAASRLCEIYYFGQDTLATTGAAILSVNMAERAGRQTEVRKQYAQLGYMAGLMRMHALARLYFQKARGGPEEEEPNGIGIARWYESSYEETFGRWARGADVADDAIRRLSATGDQGELQIARTLRGHADYYTGRFAESLPRFEEIRTAARARGNVQYEAWGTYSGARSLIALGRLDEAVEQLRESLRMLQRQEDRASEFICQGLLATVHLYRGELEAAREAADVVLRMAEGKQPAAFMERHGYEGAAMAYLELWRQGEKGARKPAERACGLLAGFGRLIPLALPAALRCAGQARQLRGHPRWARATWTRGLAVGARMGMPYDEALIRLELGSASRSGSPEREEHLRLAEQGFAAMGCVQLARRAQASREG